MRAATQITIAAALLALAVVVFGVSGWLIVKAWPAVTERIADKSEQVIPQTQSCAEFGKALEIDVSDGPEGSIVAGIRSMKEPQMDFGRASSMIAACRGYELASFCAGPGCAVGGGREMQFRLTRARSKE